jgi:hypothetical protein
MIQANKPAYQKLRSAPGITNTAERVEKDLAQAKQVVANFETEISDTRGSEAIEKYVEEQRTKKLEGVSEEDEKAKQAVKNDLVRLINSRPRCLFCLICFFCVYRTKRRWTCTSIIFAKCSTHAIIASAAAISRKSSFDGVRSMFDARLVRPARLRAKAIARIDAGMSKRMVSLVF